MMRSEPEKQEKWHSFGIHFEVGLYEESMDLWDMGRMGRMGHMVVPKQKYLAQNWQDF